LKFAGRVSRRNFRQHVPGLGTNHPMTPLAFTDLTARLAAWTFPAGIEGVVGIASGGVVPAALVAQRLGVELKALALNYRDDANQPRYAEPKLLSTVPDLGTWRRVLLVDDVYVSGKSWHAARRLLPAAVEVLPFVLKGKVEFALIRDLDGCVQWPWRVYGQDSVDAQ
jgi:adenine/guanine phosphoribosyltransferase-like PRPP-binding protein